MIHGAVFQAQVEKVVGELSGPGDGNGLRTLYQRGEGGREVALVVFSASAEGITNFVRRIYDRYGQLVEVEELAEPPQRVPRMNALEPGGPRSKPRRNVWDA